MGEIGNYEEAAKLFEGIAEEMANNQLTKYSVKDYLLRAGLCRLCLDVRIVIMYDMYCINTNSFFLDFVVFRILLALRNISKNTQQLNFPSLPQKNTLSFKKFLIQLKEETLKPFPIPLLNGIKQM